MPPNTSTATGEFVETDKLPDVQKMDIKKTVEKYITNLIWHRVIFFITIHVLALYGVYLILTNSVRLYTIGYTYVNYMLAGLGALAGAHRLWSHRSYKVKLPLKLLLVYFNTLAFQTTIIRWARDHRLHHKYSDTDADPHNITRGLFYSHMGWIFYPKSEYVLTKGKQIDVSDLFADPILRFQKKYYYFLVALVCITIPTLTPMYFWNESFINAFTVNFFRHSLNLHATFLVNSFAHMFGNKPYDQSRKGSENLGTAVFSLGEGWHNYHHAFPYDYKTSELNNLSTNFITRFVELMAKIGWAYDLRTTPLEAVKRRVERAGDGSHYLWGWKNKEIH